MKRRSTIRYTQIHVSVPVKILAEFDATLGFTESRSKKISKLMKESNTYGGDALEMFSRREIVDYLQFQFDKDSSEDVLIQALLKLL